MIGGIDYAVAKSLAAAPFADILWMETKTADLADAKEFADAVHAVYPEKMLAYNLSPSFNWDTTGMSDDEMRAFPDELAKMGFVFNFITYGGHQIDGLAGEEFAQALSQDGMLALARLQRKFRLLESPFSKPQTLAGGPRLDGALSASSGRTATTKAMGKGSIQIQHAVQTEVPPSLLQGWLNTWQGHYSHPEPLKVELRPNRAGSDLLELRILGRAGERCANVIFGTVQDRRGRTILEVRDQNTFDQGLRRKRLMTLLHLFLIHRYGCASVHYMSPTEDNQHQTRNMVSLGIYSEVNNEVGEIIVAEVNDAGVAALRDPEGAALGSLIEKTPQRHRYRLTSKTLAENMNERYLSDTLPVGRWWRLWKSSSAQPERDHQTCVRLSTRFDPRWRLCWRPVLSIVGRIWCQPLVNSLNSGRAINPPGLSNFPFVTKHVGPPLGGSDFHDSTSGGVGGAL